MRDVLVLAWPSVLSFLCNSAYRVNDQYWIGDLGPAAQAAMSASVFLLILNFSLYFLAVGGALSLVARATGAEDERERDKTIRHVMALGVGIAIVISILGSAFTTEIVGWLGLEGATAEAAAAYLRTIYLLALPMALAPIVDTVFIGMGDTRTPLILQGGSVTLNFVLNPCLIYGLGPFPAWGMAGAAAATGISRAAVVVFGLVLLRRRGVHWLGSRRIEPRRLATIARIGTPSALSITIYACVYFALIKLVITPLGDAALAGLGIGFNAFEGMAFPLYLGVAVAGSSLVGRNLGAGAEALALQAVQNVRRIALGLGALNATLFIGLATVLVPHFTDDPAVAAETIRYVRILALSQLFVAIEVVHEKVLLGAGHTRPIFWISVPGNILRVPLAWALAGPAGMGAAGVWWAINATTLMKASAFLWIVEQRTWVRMRVAAS
ncbi:MAG: MATE family efflux transporter [bacterium]|nr:MATE family efflux transporter [bacterium]